MNRGAWALGAIVALVVAGCGSTKTVTVTSTSAVSSTTASSTGAGASTSASSTASPSATTPPGATSTSSTSSAPPLHLGTFRSPSGNIGCMIVAGLARCDIQHRSWSPGPRPATCPHIVDYGQGLNVGNAGVGRLVCAGDTVMVPTAPKLAYGQSTEVAAFRCLSATAGITCTNTSTGHGFFISVQSYRGF